MPAKITVQNLMVNVCLLTFLFGTKFMVSSATSLLSQRVISASKCKIENNIELDTTAFFYETGLF